MPLPPPSPDISCFTVASLNAYPVKSILLALEQADVGIAYWDFDHQMIYWSKQLEQVYGLLLDQSQQTYQDYLERVHPEHRWELTRLIAQMNQSLEAKQIEYRVVMDGQEQWLRSCFSPGVEAGQLTHMIEVVSNISELKRVQSALVELETNLATRQRTLNDLTQLRSGISAVSSALIYRYPLPAIYATVAEALTDLLKADCVHLYQYHAQPSLWRNVYDYRRSPDLPSAIGVEFPDQDNCISNALRQPHPLQFSCQGYDGTDPEPEFIAPFFGLWLVLPIQINARIWGAVLILRFSENELWTDQEFHQAVILGDLINLAISS